MLFNKVTLLSILMLVSNFHKLHDNHSTKITNNLCRTFSSNSQNINKLRMILEEIKAMSCVGTKIIVIIKRTDKGNSLTDKAAVDPYQPFHTTAYRL